MEITSKVSVTRFVSGAKEEVKDAVACEYMLKIFVNGDELVSFLCSPKDLEYLVTGFIFSEGIIKSKADISELKIDYENGIASVKTTGPPALKSKTSSMGTIASGSARSAAEFARGDASLYPKITSKKLISPQFVSKLMKDFTQSSSVFKDTGGVHSAALASEDGILYFAEDIGRHNALEKVFGYSLANNISLKDKFILTSGRVSSEILLKTACRGVPFLISKSAPTDEGVKLAGGLGITLIGFVRGERMNIYSVNFRVEAADAG